MNFTDLVGKSIMAIVPVMDPQKLKELTIRGVEGGGIWVQSQELTNLFIAVSGLPAIKTPTFFLPFHEIKLAFAATDEDLSLSEEAFGV